MLYQTARLKYDPDEPRGRVAARRDQGLLQLRRLQREALALRRRASSRRARSTSSARARRATSPSAPTTACGRTSTPTTRRCTRPSALLVSAELHDGWLPERVAAAKGEIVPPKPGERSPVLGAENHAFLIVGYTSKGFLVLNSWGRDWGGWSPGGGAAADPGRRALALRRLGRPDHGRLGAASRRRRRRRLRVFDRRHGARLRRPTPPRARRRSTPSSATSCTSTTASS